MNSNIQDSFDINEEYNELNINVKNKVYLFGNDRKISTDSDAKTINIRSDIKYLYIEGYIEQLNVYGQVTDLDILNCPRLKQIHIYNKINKLCIRNQYYNCNKMPQVENPLIDFPDYLNINESGSVDYLSLDGLNMFPDFMNTSLPVLNYYQYCEKIQNVVKNIKKFKLKNIKNVVEMFFIKHAQEVELSGLDDVTHLNDFANVEKLIVNNLKKVRSVDCLKNVKDLCLSHMDSTDHVFDVSSLKDVHTLELHHIQVKDISMLKNKSLTVWHCLNVFNGNANFSNMNKLVIKDDSNLVNLNIHNVDDVSIDNLENLVYLSTNKANSLNVSNCENLVYLNINNIGGVMIDQCESLRDVNCNNIEGMTIKNCDGLVQFQCPIVSLCMQNCKNITDLKQFRYVQNLELTQMDGLTNRSFLELANYLGNIKNMSLRSLKNVDDLECICTSKQCPEIKFGDMKNLKNTHGIVNNSVFYISNCGDLLDNINLTVSLK